MRKGIHITLVILLCNFAYAILRYNYFGNVDWEQIPIYIANKAFAFSAICCIALSILWGKLPVRDLKIRKFLGLYGFALSVLHVLCTLTILNPEYFPRFYTNGKLQLFANIVILCGALAFLFFLIASVCSINSANQFIYVRRCVLIATIFATIHIFARGNSSWIHPNKWYGGMPPISLLSFSVAAIALFSKIIPVNRKSS